MQLLPVQIFASGMGMEQGGGGSEEVWSKGRCGPRSCNQNRCVCLSQCLSLCNSPAVLSAMISKQLSIRLDMIADMPINGIKSR